jgi:hypothetical protein
VTEQLIRAKDDDRLRGWKEIASAVHASERTAQRWEETMGLPVHRVPATRGDQVFAYRSELDAWMTAQRDQRHAGGDGSARGVQSPAAPTARPRTWRVRGTVLLVTAVALLLVGVVAVALSSRGRTLARGDSLAKTRGTVVKADPPVAESQRPSAALIFLRVSVDGDAAVTIGTSEGTLGRISVPGKGITLGVVPRHASGKLLVRLFQIDGRTVAGEPLLTELASRHLVQGTAARCELASLTVVLEWIAAPEPARR